MNRLTQQEDGTWKLVETDKRTICHFKIGDKVKVTQMIRGIELPYIGTITKVECASKENILIDVKTMFNTEYIMLVPVSRIYSMEVIE